MYLLEGVINPSSKMGGHPLQGMDQPPIPTRRFDNPFS